MVGQQEAGVAAERFFADNIYFDISGTVTLVADSPIESEFVWTLRNVGTDRLLLGSDYPFNMGDPDPLGTLEKAGLDPALTARNARRFLGLPEGSR